MIKEANSELFSVYSISYAKADAKTRGRFTFFPEYTEGFIQTLKDDNLGEAFVVSTCNRTELYVYSDQASEVAKIFAKYVGESYAEFIRYAELYQGRDALKHLFRVSSGLESQILGDFEIISQIKTWVKRFHSQKAVNHFLIKAVDTGLQISKKVKSETLLSNGSASVSFSAVNYLLQTKRPIKNILLVGTGKIGQNTCENLVKHFTDMQITVLNRTEEKAEKLAEKYRVQYAKYEDLPVLLNTVDAIIVSTNASEPIIKKEDIVSYEERVILDLSIPNNVDVEVKNNTNITLLNVDDLSKTVDETLEKRKKAIPDAEKIIQQYIEEFDAWEELRQYAPLIRDFKNQLSFLNEHNAKNLSKKNVKINGKETILADQLAQKITNRLADFILENPDKAEETASFIKSIFQLNLSNGEEH